MQTKKGSLIESIINTFIGFTVTLVASPLIYWACGVPIKAYQMGMATAMFTVLSVVRGFVIRRIFNKIIIKKAHNNDHRN